MATRRGIVREAMRSLTLAWVMMSAVRYSTRIGLLCMAHDYFGSNDSLSRECLRSNGVIEPSVSHDVRYITGIGLVWLAWDWLRSNDSLLQDWLRGHGVIDPITCRAVRYSTAICLCLLLWDWLRSNEVIDGYASHWCDSDLTERDVSGRSLYLIPW